MSMSLRIEAGPSGRDRRPLAVAQLGAGGDRVRAAPAASRSLWALKARHSLRVDLVEAVLGEERQQVADEPPAVVGSVFAIDRPVAEDAVDFASSQADAYCVEGRNAALEPGRRRTGAWTPDAGADARERRSPARRRRWLVPAAAAAARAAAPLVQRLVLPRSVGARSAGEMP